MNKYNLTATVFAGLLSSTAFAGGAAPFYLGGAVGHADIDNNQSGFDNGNICQGSGQYDEGCSVGDGGSTGHIYGGLQLGDTYAIEVGYADLGDTAAYRHNNYDDSATVTQETSGITIAGIARHRLGKSSPLLAYGKAGVFVWESEVKSSGNSYIPHGRTDDNGVDPIIGAGLEYEINHNVSLRAGWDRYYGVGDNNVLVDYNKGHSGSGSLNTLDTDVDVYSAGVNFSFY